MQKQAGAAVEELLSSGLAATPIITAGDPKQVLLDEVDGWGADCLFVWARGHNHLARFVLRSVATVVAARAFEDAMSAFMAICQHRLARKTAEA